MPIHHPKQGEEGFFSGGPWSSTIHDHQSTQSILRAPGPPPFRFAGWGGCQGGLTTEPEDMVGGTIPYRDWHPFEVIGPDHGADIKTKSPITVPKVCGSMD